MRILAFESSAKAASAAILTDGQLTAEAYQNCGLTHSVTLLAMARDLLKQTGLTLSDVDVCAVACGPGSFTGVRIGVAAVKGLCWGAEIPCIGVSTLEGMAMLHCGAEALVCTAMDARRNQVYHALFRAHNGALERLTADQAISVSALAEELSEYHEPVLLVGDGAELCSRTLPEMGIPVKLAPEYLRMQRASGVALAAYPMALRGETVSAEALCPNYLRMSQAERERLERLKNNNKV